MKHVWVKITGEVNGRLDRGLANNILNKENFYLDKNAKNKMIKEIRLINLYKDKLLKGESVS